MKRYLLFTLLIICMLFATQSICFADKYIFADQSGVEDISGQYAIIYQIPNNGNSYLSLQSKDCEWFPGVRRGAIGVAVETDNGIEYYSSADPNEDITLWKFETASAADQAYYISTVVNGEEKYLNLIGVTDSADTSMPGHVLLTSDPQAIIVEVQGDGRIMLTVNDPDLGYLSPNLKWNKVEQGFNLYYSYTTPTDRTSGVSTANNIAMLASSVEENAAEPAKSTGSLEIKVADSPAVTEAAAAPVPTEEAEAVEEPIKEETVAEPEASEEPAEKTEVVEEPAELVPVVASNILDVNVLPEDEPVAGIADVIGVASAEQEEIDGVCLVLMSGNKPVNVLYFKTAEGFTFLPYALETSTALPIANKDGDIVSYSILEMISGDNGQSECVEISDAE